MANIITGNQDGSNGENETYNIPGRATGIPRQQLVEEIKKGKHPNHSVYTLNGKEYVRSKADNTKNNNVNDE